MEQITVCSEKNLKDIIPAERIELIRHKGGKARFCFIISGSTRKDAFNCIAKYINNTLGIDILFDFLEYETEFLDEIEEDRLKENAVRRMERNSERLTEMISKQLETISAIYKCIYLDGFVRFALTEYKYTLKIIAEEATNDYFKKKEYLDFLNLFKLFTMEEECITEYLKIIVDERGKYLFYDESENNITTHCADLFKREFDDTTACENDFLISVLYLLLPKEIHLYGAEKIRNKNILKTLLVAFGSRIKIFDCFYR